MPHAHADGNLLFGILALQMDFISRDALVAAMNAWVLDKGKPLGQILREQGAFSEEHLVLLEALVQAHLKQHGNDPQQSLAAVSSVRSVRQELQQIADPELQASLGHVAARRGEQEDPYATYAPSVGASTSAGSRFRILRPHARGGLGQVYVAHDEELHREVALKEIHDRYADHTESRLRFVLEAEITGGLEHPGIVPVYGLGAYGDGRPFYAMRFIKGDSLKEAIGRFHRAERGGREPGERALELRKLLGRFLDVCNAIAYAHSRGVLHRDLKPDNIMLGQYGETLVVDWGLAKTGGRPDSGVSTEATLRPATAGDSTPTEVGSTVGTPAYMSPEQAAGRLEQLGPASDVYSLGATLYHLLTGQAPFAGPDVPSVLQRVQRGDFPPPCQVSRDVPRALQAVCLKAMALRPEDRYPSPRGLAEDVERWLADEPVSAWREPWPVRAGRWLKRHRTLVSGAAALLLTAVVALAVSTALIGEALRKEEQARQDRALAQVKALIDANPEAVPDILTGLEASRQDVLPRLRELWRDRDRLRDDAQRARVALSLLPTEPDEVKGALAAWMLRATEPQEMLLLRKALLPHKEELRRSLWREAGASGARPWESFNALVALAAFDPGGKGWGAAGEQAVRQLLSANPLHLARWARALRPVRARLLRPLRRVFLDGAPDERLVAATLLADYAEDRPEDLVDLVVQADERQYPLLLPPLERRREESVALLQRELERPELPAREVKARDLRARRQAKAGVALLQLGRGGRVWPLLEHGPDPSRRSYLYHDLGLLGVDPEILAARLEKEQDVSAQRALVLSLGYLRAPLPDGRRDSLAETLLGWYRDDPDPGIHAAVAWLLRRWDRAGHGPGYGRSLAKIDASRRMQADRLTLGARRPCWYVNGPGQTFVAFPKGVLSRTGSPPYEPDRNSDGDEKTDERLRVWRVPRAFALATTEVTVAQYREFLTGMTGRGIKVNTKSDNKWSPGEENPVNQINFFWAAAYCNWLSERDGIPRGQWCYPAEELEKLLRNPELQKQKELPRSPDYLSRTGYRLPTEAEWEYACRAGAHTSRFHGNAEQLLGYYAWYSSNTSNRTEAVATKEPNDFGLFDTLGNVAELCVGPAPGKLGPLGEAQEDVLPKVPAGLRYATRGGAFYYHHSLIRCADTYSRLQNEAPNSTGLRVARTLP